MSFYLEQNGDDNAKNGIDNEDVLQTDESKFLNEGNVDLQDEEYINKAKDELGANIDFITRKINGSFGNVYLLFLKSMTDKDEIAKQIIMPILNYKDEFDYNKLKFNILLSTEINDTTLDDEINDILDNKVVLIFKGRALSIDLEKVPLREPTEPPTSPNIHGPREGFVESIKSNICLIRKRLPTKNLEILNLNVGRHTKTKIQILYLNNIAINNIVEEIKTKISRIDIDGIIDSYYIAEFLKCKPYSLFEQVGFQEKPDIVVAKMLEGRVAIMVDGSPIVLTLPYMVFEDFQSSNDYYTNYIYVNFIRIIRTIGLLIATVIPGVYLSIRLHSYRVLPINYIITIANSTKNLPFTPLLEIVFILLLFQVLYEVSLRLPQYLGLATSIVGALVLGDTGVQAGLISPPGVIIVAVSIMAIYTVPAQASTLTILRAIFVVLGATLGIVGIMCGVIYIINYVNTLNFYDTPYLAPYSPRIKTDLKDAMFKKPLKDMVKRPKSISQKNNIRLGGKNE